MSFNEQQLNVKKIQTYISFDDRDFFHNYRNNTLNDRYYV